MTASFVPEPPHTRYRPIAAAGDDDRVSVELAHCHRLDPPWSGAPSKKPKSRFHTRTEPSSPPEMIFAETNVESTAVRR